MKRVLALHYSQTGQLSRVLESFLSGLDPEHFEVHSEALRPRREFPFPWDFGEFIDVFPECVVGDPGPLEEPSFDPDADYDLVVLSYTVWFLAPSLPVQAFLASEHARVLRDTPVVTLIACRNMWHTASLRVKRDLERLGARLLDNVVVTDQGPAWSTFVTTPRWMFTGRKDAFWRIFPPAGVAEETVAAMPRFGEALTRQRDRIEAVPPAPLLRGLDAVEIEHRFVLPELIGRTMFGPWARLARLAGGPGGKLRALVLRLFTVNLLVAVLILAPLSILFRIIFFPLIKRPLEAYTARLLAPSGLEPEAH